MVMTLIREELVTMYVSRGYAEMAPPLNGFITLESWLCLLPATALWRAGPVTCQGNP